MSYEPADIESFISMLPDVRGARTFRARADKLPERIRAELARNLLLMSRLLTLASYSPFLGETMLRHPEYIIWLKQETERDLTRVKSVEQLSEDLARFVARAGDADTKTQLARFKRRELLRIYLRDCLRVATLSEVTEELSNLADVITGHALALALREAINIHGAPQTRDERGRIAQSAFAVVALGKLGCRELNYASDIDLMFLYSGEGETAGDGRRRDSIVSNKELFALVAGRVAQMIGSKTGEGAVYRIDLRLRPYGRDGDLVWEVARAADYYRTRAENWERQMLIRARASAGSHAVVADFLARVRDVVFAPDAVTGALANVRKTKEKIDRRAAERTGGYDVKLGRGGIREIEFIAQALQLEKGGREPWLRSAQTLIVLARLAEKSHLTEQERARLSAAYTFLRTLEHRLQMEHGAQTHRLPLAQERLELLARRVGYQGQQATGELLADLDKHTSAVRAVFNRVFIDEGSQATGAAMVAERPRIKEIDIDDEAGRLIAHSAAALGRLAGHAAALVPSGEEASSLDAHKLEQALASALPRAINPLRSLRNLAAWASSLSTYTADQVLAAGWRIKEGDWAELIRRLAVLLSSQHLAQVLISRPLMASVLVQTPVEPGNFLSLLGAAVEGDGDISSRTDALRRAWHARLIDIGFRDISMIGRQEDAGEDESAMNRLRANNLEQTALAEATLKVALKVVLESQEITDAPAELPFAIMGLGRLGHRGMDYGSDLDLLFVYDDDAPWPAGGRMKSPGEFCAALASELIHRLSSITREGLLYRIDLRLRPDGASGQLASGLGGLLAYLKRRASAWEHSAYLKLREVAGNLVFGARARSLIGEAVFEAAADNDSLKSDLLVMRGRLEREKARAARPDIKWGRGGMTDVYFITRYLQLRDHIDFPTERGTTALIKHLGERDTLEASAAGTLYAGYSFLRRLDHWMRLLSDRPTQMLPASQIALADLARALELDSAERLEQLLAHHTSAIRAVFEKVFE
jgi:glutamate-ammonia-ligase adenylyltransferase